MEHAAFTSNLPFSGSNSSGSYSILGRDTADGEASPHGMQRQVAGDYFQALKIPLHADGWSTVLADARLRADSVHANAAGYARFTDGLVQTLQSTGLLSKK